MSGSRFTGLFRLVIAALALTTLIGMIALWPNDDGGATLGEGLAATTESAEVTAVESFQCPEPQTGTCRQAMIELQSGPDAGGNAEVDLGPEGVEPAIAVGDQLRVAANPTVPEQGGAVAYSIVDFERKAPMLWLALMFAALVIVFGRARGALSLVGLGLSLAVVLGFIVPSILEGNSPLLVAFVGSLAVMLVTIPLAHGLGPKSLAAILGTAVSLLLVIGLAEAFTQLTNLTGISSEEAAILQVNDFGIDLRGLLIAGMVIGALGVLDDVTVSQASTVLALKAANPGQGFRELYARAIAVGQDHVSATVNTLVLAYVGSALPALLIFGSGDIGALEAANLELVAKEIVGTLVGSVGLIAAVPITTALAGLLATRLPGEQLSAAAVAGHSH